MNDRLDPHAVSHGAARVAAPARGPRGIRTNAAFSPTSPQTPAGMRIEPPPSPPVAKANNPPATPAAEPPDDPPGVRPRYHGL